MESFLNTFCFPEKKYKLRNSISRGRLAPRRVLRLGFLLDPGVFPQKHLEAPKFGGLEILEDDFPFQKESFFEIPMLVFGGVYNVNSSFETRSGRTKYTLITFLSAKKNTY